MLNKTTRYAVSSLTNGSSFNIKKKGLMEKPEYSKTLEPGQRILRPLAPLMASTYL